AGEHRALPNSKCGSPPFVALRWVDRQPVSSTVHRLPHQMRLMPMFIGVDLKFIFEATTMMPRSANPVFIAALLAFSAAPAAAQSFNCRAAYYPDERTICAAPRLGQLDEQLTALYLREAGNLASEQRDAFHDHEINFVTARRRCGDN